MNYFQHNGGDGKPDLYENTKPVAEPGYLTDILTRRAVEFVDLAGDEYTFGVQLPGP